MGSVPIFFVNENPFALQSDAIQIPWKSLIHKISSNKTKSFWYRRGTV